MTLFVADGGAITKYIERANAYSDDSYFQIENVRESSLGDIAKAHAKNLYRCNESEIMLSRFLDIIELVNMEV